jgi:hypothetical protein
VQPWRSTTGDRVEQRRPPGGRERVHDQAVLVDQVGGGQGSREDGSSVAVDVGHHADMSRNVVEPMMCTPALHSESTVQASPFLVDDPARPRLELAARLADPPVDRQRRDLQHHRTHTA